MNLVYLAGPPGVGKSTLMAELTAECTRDPGVGLLPHDTLTVAGRIAGCELGRRRERFAGTDALSLSIQPAALAFIGEAPHRLVLAEGDRLANLAFLDAGLRAGYRVDLIVLEARREVLDARCTARGSRQSPAWRAGRTTKTNRLAAHAETAGVAVWWLNGTLTPAALAGQCRRIVPALTGLTAPLPGGR